MKDLYIDLVNHTQGVTNSAVILPQLENSMPYVKRTDKICVMCKGVSKKIKNYITAFIMNGHEVILYCNKGIFYNEQALTHISEVIASRYEDFKDNELLSNTWNLIIKNHIPMDVVKNIDAHIPVDMLSMYDIQLGQTEVPVVKMNTYKPTDLQRKDWQVADKDFMFSKDSAKIKTVYKTTLYNKLIAYLQLQYYIQNGIEPLYTMEELNQEPVTPYCAYTEENLYEQMCY